MVVVVLEVHPADIRVLVVGGVAWVKSQTKDDVVAVVWRHIRRPMEKKLLAGRLDLVEGRRHQMATIVVLIQENMRNVEGVVHLVLLLRNMRQGLQNMVRILPDHHQDLEDCIRVDPLLPEGKVLLLPTLQCCTDHQVHQVRLLRT